MSEWETIDRLPKNGKKFIFWNGEEMMILNQPEGCALGRWSKIKGKWFGSCVDFENPTHFMKLPKTPK